MKPLYLICLTTVLVTSTASAREAVLGMSERIFKVINQAQLLMEEQKYDQALNKLADSSRGRASPYEQAQVLRLTGLVHYNAGDMSAALDAFDQALAQPRLPESLISNLLATVGRVALAMENYAYAEVKITELMGLSNQDTPDNAILLASAFMGQEKYPPALRQLQKAVTQKQAAGEQPRESWLTMLASVHYAMESFEEMRDIMRTLVELYPREQYIMNLAALHGQLGDQQAQLALVEAMLDDNRLKQEQHLKLLVNLFLAEELPFKAAQLLERSLADGTVAMDADNLELLSQAWYAAGNMDKAWPPLERAAAKTDDGKIYLRLASLHMDAYRWEAADDAAEMAIQSGALRNEGRAWLIRGMARVRLDDLGTARDYFELAAEDESSAAYAGQWLAYVANEERTKRSLATAR